ncbi:PAS domain-containing protein [Heliobacillus mobilis]|uniref:HTH-type transcriptional regulatory protein TyrR n=1 Tax=Heliobacterium mobile TaxID=28064 RepID=A0A6I3SP68_HELMO|nr:sigma 54-interacting transcriptional regulator [Heliobacterium mobile]MTV50689.1 PAS domain-containing protein [Heliobacterium mobile]
MLEYVMQIDFIDRPGLGYEIFECCEKNKVDKIAMEASPKSGMMIKFRCESAGQVQPLISDLKELPGIQSIRFRDQMPSEERAHELNTILNSVSEGIIAVDKDGAISHINEVACRIFLCSKEEAIGLGAERLFQPNPPILETLRTGKAYHLLERKIKRGSKIVHFLTSGEPVINAKGQIIGAVSTVKDFHQVREIISKVDRRHPLICFDDIVYQSVKMDRLVTTAKTVAKGTSTVLLRGESGTGKEMFAAAIHMESPRHRGPFIAINCAALPDNLLESELFGYEEGAFTGASKGGKKGLFEQANSGTLFLDEIGEISPQVQVRLLRVLQEGRIRRVGGSTEIPVDVRIIAATHRNLEEMTKRGSFREDLYYRLNVIPLRIPPLRERVDDIPLVAQQLIRKISGKLNKPEVRLSRESVALLMGQQWPGNVRQLENALERLLNLVDTPEIQPHHLQEWTDIVDIPLEGEAKPEVLNDFAGGTSKSFADSSSAEEPPSVTFHDRSPSPRLCLEIPLSAGDRLNWPPLKSIVAEVEKAVLQKVLESHLSSRQAGQILGVSNTTVLNKIHTYGIDR